MAKKLSSSVPTATLVRRLLSTASCAAQPLETDDLVYFNYKLSVWMGCMCVPLAPIAVLQNAWYLWAVSLAICLMHWVCFYCAEVPVLKWGHVIFSPVRVHFPTFGHLLGFDRLIAAGKLSAQLPMYLLILSTNICVTCLVAIPVFLYEVPSANFDMAVYVTYEQVANRAFTYADPVTAARSLVNLNQSHIGSVLLFSMTFLLLSLCMQMTDKGYELLEKSREACSAFSTSVGSGPALLRMLNDAEEEASEKSRKGAIMRLFGPIAILFASLDAYLIFYWQRATVQAAVQVAPISIGVYVYGCTTVALPACCVAWYAMEIMARRCAECVNLLDHLSEIGQDRDKEEAGNHTSIAIPSASSKNKDEVYAVDEEADHAQHIRFCSLDPTDFRDVAFWTVVRGYVVAVRVPLMSALNQVAFALSLVIVLICFSAALILVFFNGQTAMEMIPVQAPLVTASTLALFLLRAMYMAVSVWDSQQSHIGTLQDAQARIQWKLTFLAHSSEPLPEASIASPSTVHKLPQSPSFSLLDASLHLTHRFSISHPAAAANHASESGTVIVSPDKKAPLLPHPALSSEHPASPSAVAQNGSPTAGEIAESSTAVTPLHPHSPLPGATMEMHDLHATASGRPKAWHAATTTKPSDSHPHPMTTGPPLSKAPLAALQDTLNRLTSLIQHHDRAPNLYGIPLKPTLVRLVAGYVISASAVVVSKLTFA